MIKATITNSLLQAIGKSGFAEASPEVTVPEKGFGDFTTNVAMIIASKSGQNPRGVAEAIVENLDRALFSEVQIAGPGFINLTLRDSIWQDFLTTVIAADANFGRSEIGKGKKILLDYSHPNIAKPIGVHHLLTTLIGESIKRIHNFLGYETVADNFLGDWGTQFGKTIYAYKQWGDREKIEKDPINELLALYVQFHEAAEKSPELDDAARLEFKKLEEGDKENTEIWEWMREESLKELKEIYEVLDVEFDYFHGEAFYNDKTGLVISELEEKNIIEIGREGAKIVELSDKKLGVAIVQKSDGATIYLTRDLAAIKYRSETFEPEKIIYVVENAQGLHLAQAFEIAKKADLNHDSELIHVKFGTMSFPEGKMSTRKGKVVFLWQVLETAAEKAKKIIEEKSLNVENVDALAQTVGIGAVKYAVLSQNRQTNVQFTWDRIMSLEGNSAQYIMYAFVRTNSILEKSGGKSINSDSSLTVNEEEREVLKKIFDFERVIVDAAKTYQPNLVANNLFELSQSFNHFYNKHSVIGSEGAQREFRLALTQAVGIVLKNGMKLLSIELPERM